MYFLKFDVFSWGSPGCTSENVHTLEKSTICLKRFDQWVSELVSEWVGGWVSEWVSEGVGEWVSEWVSEWASA